jgi:hypothetical protein
MDRIHYGVIIPVTMRACSFFDDLIFLSRRRSAVVFGLLLDSRAKFELTEVIQVMCHYASYLRFKNRQDVNAPPITHHITMY